MTEIRFYHLQHQSQMQVIPALLSKALERGHRVVVKMKDENDVSKMNAHLWEYRADSFIPHGSAADGNEEMQPVWLTTQDENPNKADVFIICQGVESAIQSDFTLCCEMLDGHDGDAVTAARERWKAYKEQEFDVTYWQQNEGQGWEQKQ